MAMKTLLLGSALALAAATALAQGTVNFVNVQGTLNVPVYQADGVTKLSGNQFMAELLASRTAFGNFFSIATSGFLTGAGAGYFNGGVRTITGIAGGESAWLWVRFWNTAYGSTFAAAQSVGASGVANAYGTASLFQVTLGDPSAQPPGVPASLSGLAGQTLRLVTPLPEPSALALVGLGLSSLLFRRRTV
jgi:hypothetical protein